MIFAIATALLSQVSPVGAQDPAGLAARALADTGFRWERDSLPGLRAYYVPGTYAYRYRDSLSARAVDALRNARQLIGVPELAGPVDVFFIDSRAQMRQLVGAPVTGFAHMAARAVFLVTNPEWRAFERHEIMHVVAAQGWNHRGANAWLQEGLAQAADGSCAGFTNQDVALALAQRHGWIPLDTMIAAFREQEDLRAYLQAAAFTSYLLQHAGPAAVRGIWAEETTPATRVGQLSLEEWERRWRSSARAVDRVPLALLDAIEKDGCGIAAPR